MMTHKEFNEKALPVIAGLVGEKSANEIIEAIRPIIREMAFSIIECAINNSFEIFKNGFKDV